MSSSLGFPHLGFTSVEAAHRDTLPHAELYWGECIAEGPQGLPWPPRPSILSTQPDWASSGTYTLSQPASAPDSCLVGELLEQKPQQHREAENLQRGARGGERGRPLLPCSDTCTSTHTLCRETSQGNEQRACTTAQKKQHSEEMHVAWEPHQRQDPEDDEKPGDGKRSYLCLLLAPVMREKCVHAQAGAPMSAQAWVRRQCV